MSVTDPDDLSGADPFPEPAVRPWPGWLRLLMIVGMTALLWTIILVSI